MNQVIAYDLRAGWKLKNDRRAKAGNNYERSKCYAKDLGYYLESYWRILNMGQPWILEKSSGRRTEHSLFLSLEIDQHKKIEGREISEMLL